MPPLVSGVSTGSILPHWAPQAFRNVYNVLLDSLAAGVFLESFPPVLGHQCSISLALEILSFLRFLAMSLLCGLSPLMGGFSPWLGWAGHSVVFCILGRSGAGSQAYVQLQVCTGGF